MSAPVTAAGRTLAMGQDEARGARASVDAPFGKALVESAKAHPEIVGLTADLGKYTDIHPFRDSYPDRFFMFGMAEQNLSPSPRVSRERESFLRHDVWRFPPAAPTISSPSRRPLTTST